MSAAGVLVFLVSAVIQGAVATTCYGATASINCLFGCCSDTFYVYCCLSNGAGIGIIVGVIVMILSTCFICLRIRRRRALYRNIAVGQKVYNTPGTTVTQGQTAYSQPNTGYGQPNPGYGQPPTGFGQPNPGYGQSNTSYATAPPPYNG
ncbi:protein shisa-4-like [Haliotis asinina]|uniref:protein shisa-4-like n=1 Tax=Haliotis asinina TaxID=109174 RepID=UPI00353272A2